MARKFTLIRSEDETGFSGTGKVAEGIEFSDGVIALRWMVGVHQSTVLWDDIESVEAIHGHGGKTKVVFDTPKHVVLTTGQVLTITHDKLVCFVGDLYDALNALTGDNLMTHQLPRGGKFAKPFIKDALPWTDSIEPFDGEKSEEGAMAYIAEIDKVYGTHHAVPYLGDEWDHINPLEEIVALFEEGWNGEEA